MYRYNRNLRYLILTNKKDGGYQEGLHIGVANSDDRSVQHVLRRQRKSVLYRYNRNLRYLILRNKQDGGYQEGLHIGVANCDDRDISTLANQHISKSAH